MSDLPPYPRIGPQRPDRLRAAARQYRERAAVLRQTLHGVEAEFAEALDAAEARQSIEQRLDAHAKRSGHPDSRRLKLGTKENQ